MATPVTAPIRTEHLPAPRIRSEHLQVKGVDVAVQICGEGTPLLLLSGIWAELPLWKPLLPYLHGFKAIAFDPPGVGTTRSTKRPMTMHGLAGFTASVLSALEIDRAHVLGASFGGAVAQQLAVSHRRRVRRLILVSTSFGGFAIPGSPRAFWHFIHPAGYSPQRLAKNAGSMFGGRMRTHPGLVKSLHFSRPSGVRAAASRAFPLWAWTSLPWLPAITQPTLVIAGDDDPITPLINHRVIARLIPRARLHIVRGGGHLALLDSPDLVAPEIVEFLRADEA